MQSRRAESSNAPKSRLLVIAPKDEQPSGPASPQQSTSPVIGSPGVSKTRLPPRSRTGCWTCRTRKVKCDEQRPTCSHACDYNPRVTFRDDTPRVVDRYAGGSSAWERQSSSREGSRSRSGDDVLPPFSDLRTDEDRERKAESRQAGTFHVVAVPDSFSALPEYRDEDERSDADGGSEDDEEDEAIQAPDPMDPDVVILRRFEDVGRRPSTQASGRSLAASPAPLSAGLSQNLVRLTVSPRGTDNEPSDQAIEAEDPNSALLKYYREVLSPQLVWTAATFSRRPSRASLVGRKDVFEEEAPHFLPLWHSMMALSALSLAHQTGVQSLDALQHYQQALSLQRTLSRAEDICSDGALFANYVLLLYEIAAAEHDGHTLWQSHFTQLLRITLMRRERFGHEQHTYLVWCTCMIDTYALLGRSSKGGYVRTLMDMNLLPTVQEQLPPLPEGGICHSNERNMLPSVLCFNHHIVRLAAQLGQLARELHHEAEHGLVPNNRQNRVLLLRNGLQRALTEWPECIPRDWHRGTMSTPALPPRVRITFEHAFALHRACIIYAHTSMWPYQRGEADAMAEEEISQCSSAILNLCRNIVEHKRFQHRFVMYPVFMAGFASPSAEDKMAALDLMSVLERDSLGRNAASMRQLLQAIYCEQNEAMMSGGHPSQVDWVEVVKKHDWQVVYFGL
ncbi:MAG: hypothetical protein M1817_001845 [Caeruleum heppii]|nr:MAG: hypothetical protein M1817_001845 [Caeruleum heppii]